MNEIYKATPAKRRASCFHYAISHDAGHSRYFLVRCPSSFCFNEKVDTRFWCPFRDIFIAVHCVACSLRSILNSFFFFFNLLHALVYFLIGFGEKRG